MHLDERPDSVNNILMSLKYWNKNQCIIFLEQFIQDNCDTIKTWLSQIEIDLNLEDKDEKTLKVQILNLLQNVKKEDKIELPQMFNN